LRVPEVACARIAIRVAAGPCHRGTRRGCPSYTSTGATVA
jgi:hypothetical protein